MKKTTFPKYGFNISGFMRRNVNNGEMIEKFTKRPFKNYEQSVESFYRIFQTSNGNNRVVLLNNDALDTCISFIEDLRAFYSKPGQWPYETRGASILIVINNKLKANSCKIKLIDLGSLVYKGPDYIDKEFILGLSSLLDIFKNFKNCNKNLK